jgi:hypothetical protein
VTPAPGPTPSQPAAASLTTSGAGTDKPAPAGAATIQHVPVADQPRYLHRNSAYGEPPGYTTHPSRAMRGEPEPLTPEQLTDLRDTQERAHREAQLTAWRESRANLSRSIAYLYSQRKRRDVHTRLRALERELDRIDQLLQHGY